MGTGFKDGCQTGIIPQVMNVLFGKIEALQHQIEFQLHVSFIEVCCQFFAALFLKFHCSLTSEANKVQIL